MEQARKLPAFQAIFMECDQCIIKKYPKGRYFSDVVDSIPCVGLLEKGSLDVYLDIEDGDEIHVNTLEPMDMFGLSTFGENASMPTILRCKENATIRLIPKTLFFDKLWEKREWAESYTHYTAQKIRFLIEKIRFHCIPTARNKLITFLLQELDDQGLVHLDCTREDLCRKIGVSRAHLFRELNFLKEKGVLICHRKSFCILSQDKLMMMQHPW